MSGHEHETVGNYGLMAEFDSPKRLIEACGAARQAGYTKMDAYTPYPIEAVWEALGHHKSKLPLLVLPHGGPDWMSLRLFDTWSHYFAARGYSVLRPNYRGGVGYGREFYEANRGRLGEIELAEGVKKSLDAGPAEKLLEQIDAIADVFWQTEKAKGMGVYPPA